MPLQFWWALEDDFFCNGRSSTSDLQGCLVKGTAFGELGLPWPLLPLLYSNFSGYLIVVSAMGGRERECILWGGGLPILLLLFVSLIFLRIRLLLLLSVGLLKVCPLDARSLGAQWEVYLCGGVVGLFSHDWFEFGFRFDGVRPKC